MIVNATSFVRQARSQVPLARKSTDAFHRALHLDQLRQMVQRTPVDTGRARGSWQSSYAQPSTDNVKGVGRRPTAGQTLRLLRRDPFVVSWVVNLLPYIAGLDDGRSDQAPAGMTGPYLAGLQVFPDRVQPEGVT